MSDLKSDTTLLLYALRHVLLIHFVSVLFAAALFGPAARSSRAGGGDRRRRPRRGPA